MTQKSPTKERNKERTYCEEEGTEKKMFKKEVEKEKRIAKRKKYSEERRC